MSSRHVYQLTEQFGGGCVEDQGSEAGADALIGSRCTDRPGEAGE